MKNATGSPINHPRNRNPNTSTRANFFVVSEHLFDSTGQLLGQNLDIFVRLKTTDDAELSAHQVGDHDVGS
ncbi:hypothetical protein D3C83_219050 [compost metagenome]